MTRALRRWIARLMIGIVLFGQFAVAAHACEVGTDSLAATVAAAPLHDGVPCPDAIAEPTSDDAATPVCTSHCQFGQQSADHAQPPVVLPALLAALYTLPADTGSGPPGAPAGLPALRAGASPPLAILLCCLRN